MSKLLQRGIDPYADVDVTDERTGWVGPIANVVSGTTEAFAPALHKGRVRAVTVAPAVVDVEADGLVIAQVTVPVSSIGDIVRAAILDDSGVAEDNFVNQLSNLSVVSDGGATAGAVDWYLHISSEDGL